MKNFKLPLTVNHSGMSVPYQRPNDSNSHDYIDSKAHPEQIDDLPEVKDWPELKAAIKTINGFNGLRTLGCGIWRESDPQGRIVVLSYINFCFVVPELRDYVEPYFGFYHMLGIQLYDATLPDDLKIAVELKRTGFNRGKVAVGWSMDYDVWGFGDSVDQAKAVANVAYDHLLSFIKSEWVRDWVQ